MSKKITLIVAAVLAVLILITMFTACGNKDMFDTVYTYDRAIITLPDGTIVEGTVENWTDYESDQIQVKVDGKTYLVHSENIVLIAE